MKQYLQSRLVFPIVFILISCTGKINTFKKPDYNTSINRQFWTADWSPDDKLIAVGGVDSLLRIYNANNLNLYKSFPMNSWIHVVKWHADSKTLAIATLNKYVKLLNIETGNIITLNGKGGSRALAWNYNATLLAVADLEGIIKIWDNNGVLLKTIDEKYGPEVIGESFLGLDWHPSENVLVATNFQINLFDTAGRKLKVMEHRNKQAIILCVKWHPSGKFFVIGDYGHNWEGEKVPSLLHFWSEDGSYIRSVPGSKAEYRNISWNKEGTLLATASDVLRIWTKEGILKYESSSDSSNYLWGIDWNTKSDKVVTASRFKTVAVWDSTARIINRR
jgi:WD40 repeat protein